MTSRPRMCGNNFPLASFWLLAAIKKVYFGQPPRTRCIYSSKDDHVARGLVCPVLIRTTSNQAFVLTESTYERGRAVELHSLLLENFTSIKVCCYLLLHRLGVPFCYFLLKSSVHLSRDQYTIRDWQNLQLFRKYVSFLIDYEALQERFCRH